jgi:hypothetical protein
VKTVYPGEEQYLSKILNQTRIHMVSMDVCTHFALVLEEQGHSSTLLRLDCRTQRHRKARTGLLILIHPNLTSKQQWYSLSIPELTSEWKNVALLSKPFYGRNLSHVLPKVYPGIVTAELQQLISVFRICVASVAICCESSRILE